MLLHAVKGISQWTGRAVDLGSTSTTDIDRWALEATFATVTNVNFDSDRHVDLLKQADRHIVAAKELYEKAVQAKGGKPEKLGGAATWRLEHTDAASIVKDADEFGIAPRWAEDKDVTGMQELIMYGLKGLMAYADHARRLGHEDPTIYGDIRQSLRMLGDNEVRDIPSLVAEALKVGDLTVRVLALLSNAHTSRYGHPKPVQVPTYTRPGKAILVSGHDLRDLEELLKQIEKKGAKIDVYTHGEMLPAHGYPGLKEKYPNLFGNFGGAWMLQQMEFPQFKGPIVLTSNCLLEPRKSYKDRVYTMNSVGFPGVKHLSTPDFSKVIEQALSMEGFTKEPLKKTHVMTGFGHNAVLGVADKIVDAVKGGAIKHFFVVGGCDGAEGERSYFRDVAQGAPKDSVVLTLGCGKYRFNGAQEQFGDIGGIPRLLDMGQCNDAYSAVVVALALQKAFGAKTLNDLPLSFAVSWFEQKAVAVLLALLKLDVKRIRLGPKAPAFVTPNMLDLLVKNFDLKIVGNASEDLNNMLRHQ